MKSLSELLPLFQYVSVHGAKDRSITSIEDDSRKCIIDSLFVAIQGTSTDGHLFIEKAITNGARTIVCELLPENLHADCTYLHTDNSRIASALLSQAFYDFPSQSLKIIGVTGTNGKTTITFLLKQILEQLGEKVGLIGTTGNYIADEYYPTNYTTPEAPELARLLSLMKSSGVTTVVMEVSSHSLTLNRVLGITFSGAIFTNLTHDHLDFHGSMEHYAAAKKILFDALPTGAISVLNSDNSYTSYLASTTKSKAIFVGRAPNSEYAITNEIITAHGSTFSLNSYDFTTPLVGRFNIDNCAACIAYLTEAGYAAQSLLTALPNAKGAPGRMESYRLENGSTAIIDYAHTPDALENALKTCKELLQHNNKLIVVFGCGGDRDRSKRAVMGRIAEQYADTIYLTNDNPRSESPENIIQDIISGIHQNVSVTCILDREQAIDTAISFSNSNDILLIAGKGHEEYQIIQGEKRYCSDKDEVLKHTLQA